MLLIIRQWIGCGNENTEPLSGQRIIAWIFVYRKGFERQVIVGPVWRFSDGLPVTISRTKFCGGDKFLEEPTDSEPLAIYLMMNVFILRDRKC